MKVYIIIGTSSPDGISQDYNVEVHLRKELAEKRRAEMEASEDKDQSAWDYSGFLIEEFDLIEK